MLVFRGLLRLRTNRTLVERYIWHSTSVVNSNAGLQDIPALVFDNAQEVFGHRTTHELLRAFFVLHACAIEPLVERSHKLMNVGNKILGPTLLSKIVAPFYYQFVAGDSEREMEKVAENLSSVGASLMIAPMLETDIDDDLNERAELFDHNFEKTLQLIELSWKCKPARKQLRPVCQTKITAHISADVLYKVSAYYNGLSPNQRKSLVQEIGDVINRKKVHPSDSCKPLNLPLSKNDLDLVEQGLLKLFEIGKLSKKYDIILAVDAEYTYANSAISLFTLALMVAFNDGPPTIWNTYQGYLKESKYWLRHDLEMMQSLGVTFGAKIVRGAYLDREREYAKINNLPYPCQDSYELTNKNYDSLIDYLVPYVAKSEGKSQILVATHNEASVVNAIKNMALYNMPNCSPNMLFAQIYGMAENISVPLAKSGYCVYKSVPYGNMNEVIPYLSRRASENRAVFRGARRERALLSQEIRRRLKFSSP